jgi:hypothetical protein
MNEEFVFYGSIPCEVYVWPPFNWLEGNLMTAIAIAYDSQKDEFAIAADGRCAVYTVADIQVVSDTEQKIFAIESSQVKMAYSLTGISAFGSFQLVPEIRSQLEMLSDSPLRAISIGYQFAYKAFTNIGKELDKAIRDGRLPGVPPCALIPPDEGTKKFSLFLFGYFRGERFSSQGDFHYDEASHRFSVRPYHIKLVQNQVWHTGSRVIGRMLFDSKAEADPRIAQFRNDPNRVHDALIPVRNFVEACSLLTASEIDPLCRITGGHLHSATVTRNGFKWDIPPISFS